MKAIVCNEWCKPEDLKVSEIKSPENEKDSVRINVYAAGVNFPDVLIIQGKYQFKPPFPFSPGSEVAGVISEIGRNVKNFQVGDKVMAVTGHGAFAEEICVSESKLTRIPEEMDFITAASMSLTYGTSTYALFQRAQIKKDHTVLVHGSTGGVGITALEISKAVGAKVIATASTDEVVITRIVDGNPVQQLVNKSDLLNQGFTEAQIASNNSGIDGVTFTAGGG